DAERLDELSVTDEECAERLRAVEYDLLDAFARGELHGTVLQQFRSRYLTTPRGREAARLAEALQSLEPEAPVREQRHWREWLAVAATIVALVSGSVWLMLDNRALRARVTIVESSRDELLRDRQLREAEARQRVDTPLTMATLVLAPPLRSA